jgi:hypothetical protein
MTHGVEIRQLDSDRQSLVYNHHHELIAASDTISAVCYLDLLVHLMSEAQLSHFNADENTCREPGCRS